MTPDTPTQWREYFRPFVAEILEMAETCGMSEQDIAREFRAAWKIQVERYSVPSPWPKMENPDAWGESYPYMIWRDEIARQRGRLTGRMLASKDPLRRQREAESAGQLRLFGERGIIDS